MIGRMTRPYRQVDVCTATHSRGSPVAVVHDAGSAVTWAHGAVAR